MDSRLVSLIRLLLLVVLGTAPAFAGPLDRTHADALLPPNQAFALLPVEKQGQSLKLSWNVAPGYYLYRHRILVELLAPTDTGLAPIRLPEGIAHVDEHFGAVRIYRGLLEANIPLTQAPTHPLRLRISFQGCADVGVCYPPQQVLQDLAP